MPLHNFGRFFASGSSNGARLLLDEEIDPLVHRRHNHEYHSAIPAKEVTKVALKLKYLYALPLKAAFNLSSEC